MIVRLFLFCIRLTAMSDITLTINTRHIALLTVSICSALLISCASKTEESSKYTVSISQAEAAVAKKETNGKQALLKYMNESREKKGRAPLVNDPRLSRAAQKHSQEMNQRGIMTHTGKDGSNFSTRLQRQGYPLTYSAENLANAPSALWVNNMWIVSPKHKKNLFNKKYNRVGIGKAGRYWTAVYAAATDGGSTSIASSGSSSTLPPPAVSYAGNF